MSTTTDSAIERAAASVAGREWRLLPAGEARPASGGRTYDVARRSSRHFWGMPFGGTKSSGIGREESIEELLSYTELKAVNVLV
jgi:hypothetical protein